MLPDLYRGQMMTGMKRFGEYAVEMGYCSEDDVHRAVEIQKDLAERGFPRMLIGIVMVRYGILNNHQLIEILKVLDKDRVEALLPG